MRHAVFFQVSQRFDDVQKKDTGLAFREMSASGGTTSEVVEQVSTRSVGCHEVQVVLVFESCMEAREGGREGSKEAFVL